MNNNQLQSILESVLFVAGKEVRLKQLVALTGADESDIMHALNELHNQYKQDHTRGIRLLAHEGGVELVTAGKNASFVAQIASAEQKQQKEALSDASMETLAVLVYRGPLSKAAIDHLRGINSSLILRNLLIRGIAEKIVNQATREELYQVSAEFLRQMGKDRLEEFPDYAELHAQPLPIAVEINETSELDV